MDIFNPLFCFLPFMILSLSPTNSTKDLRVQFNAKQSSTTKFSLIRNIYLHLFSRYSLSFEFFDIFANSKSIPFAEKIFDKINYFFG